ncbi:MAG: SH3 domain-containing protein [Phototrophicaceae bacterium]
MFKRLFIIIILIIGVVVSAQEETAEPELTPEVTDIPSEADTCPALVANALDFTQSNCSDASTNEACYGYIFIDAQFRSDTAQFIEPGDIEDVINIQSVQLSPLDVASGQWGVIVLRVEPNANLDNTNTLPTDDVQIILYGDAQLNDASQFIEVRANQALAIYERPNTENTIIGNLNPDEPVIANGRLDDNSWYRIRISDAGEVGIGWIAADSVTASFDPETLPIITAQQIEQPEDDIAVQYGPMQAFVFESANADAPCEEAPNSGMLIQTPDGVASVNILLDEVIIQLDGTGVVSAQADGNLTIGVIEGSLQVETEDGVSTAVAGEAIDVPLDSDLRPTGAPEAARPLSSDEVQALPTNLLDDPVIVPIVNSNSGIDLRTASDGFGWFFSYNTPPPYTCSDGTDVTLASAGVAPSVTAEIDAIVISGLRFPEVSDGVYRTSYLDPSGNLITDTLQVTSPERITGERVFDLVNPICTLTVSFSIQFGAR